MRSSIMNDQQFNFSLQTIKLCKVLMDQKEYALSHQLMDDVTLLQDWIDNPKSKKVDLTKKLVKLSSSMEKTQSQLLRKGEFTEYVKEAKELFNRLTV